MHAMRNEILGRLTFLNFAERDRPCILINFKREDYNRARKRGVDDLQKFRRHLDHPSDCTSVPRLGRNPLIAPSSSLSSSVLRPVWRKRRKEGNPLIFSAVWYYFGNSGKNAPGEFNHCVLSWLTIYGDRSLKIKMSAINVLIMLKKQKRERLNFLVFTIIHG